MTIKELWLPLIFDLKLEGAVVNILVYSLCIVFFSQEAYSDFPLSLPSSIQYV